MRISATWRASFFRSFLIRASCPHPTGGPLFQLGRPNGSYLLWMSTNQQESRFGRLKGGIAPEAQDVPNQERTKTALNQDYVHFFACPKETNQRKGTRHLPALRGPSAAHENGRDVAASSHFTCLPRQSAERDHKNFKKPPDPHRKWGGEHREP